ncbi:hypothetical protein C1Y63_03215 [Corynebacterium sp. 13CS0277]|uniref:hypothetical protein n=1 Tax=Corynebacterium sp. 13CS0277 TaxID=2071994 RepID=UPI000D0318A1|nr:hypothetical protein [Corynebacterium sp. 13CS0277]PRQ12090.1 hypothetical protein C1Y63_03215 [Corynebacterium sp. 13CS0277]
MIAFPDATDPAAISPTFAVWATSWLAGDVPTDDFLDEARAGLYLADVHLWATLREHLQGHPSYTGADDHLGLAPVRLVLGGAGHVSPLPDGFYVAGAPGAGLWRVTAGDIEHIDAPLPSVPPAAAGDALHCLGEATTRASMMIENLGFRPLVAGPRWQQVDLPGPPVARDLPAGAPTRVLQLFARATSVEATVAAAREQAGELSLDPLLVPLGAAVRAAYEAAVEATARALFPRA